MCRQLIQGMQFDRFDLWGGELSPDKAEACRLNNSCTGMIGVYV
jgi:hypothetical protein